MGFHGDLDVSSPLRHGTHAKLGAMTVARPITIADVRVGCAGWALPSHSAAAFADGDSVLQRYANRFPIVEINSSFYRSHRADTYARWAATVPPGFQFSVKMPRTVSHESGLRGTAGLLSRFLDDIHHLGERLGGVLLQLPPSLIYDGRIAASFFRGLRRRTDVRVACEPRHKSWFSDTADATLLRHGIARVAADPACVPEGALPGGAREWTYWRWHGHPRMYYSKYEESHLRKLAANAKELAVLKSPAWVILDNTAAGNAVPNALRLQTLLRGDLHA